MHKLYYETKHPKELETLKEDGDIQDYSLYDNAPQVAVVTAIDTKNKTARAKFKGAKLVTEAI